MRVTGVSVTTGDHSTYRKLPRNKSHYRRGGGLPTAREDRARLSCEAGTWSRPGACPQVREPRLTGIPSHPRHSPECRTPPSSSRTRCKCQTVTEPNTVPLVPGRWRGQPHTDRQARTARPCGAGGSAQAAPYSHPPAIRVTRGPDTCRVCRGTPASVSCWATHPPSNHGDGHTPALHSGQ